MKTILMLIILALLLSSCTYLERLRDFAGLPNKEKPSPIVEAQECNDDIQCIQTNLQLCSKAKGSVEKDGERGEIEVLELASEGCVFKYDIKASADSALLGKTLTCIIPSSNQNFDISYLLSYEAGYCAGRYNTNTWITFITPGYLANDKITIENNLLVFNLQNQNEDMYLNDITITGPYFSDCYVSFKRPYSVRQKESKEFSLACDKIDTSYDYLPGKIRINTTTSGQERILQGYFSAKVI